MRPFGQYRPGALAELSLSPNISNPKAYIEIILFDPTPDCSPDSQIDPIPIDCDQRLAHKYF